MKISACLIVKNEEKYLDRCLKSIYKYVDEIIITDTGSTDKTLEIAKKYTDKIYFFEWINNFSAARNFCQSHANGDYILRIDADEYFHEKDIESLVDYVKNNISIDTLDIKMKFYDKKRGMTIYNQQCIIYRKNISWKWKVHEVLDLPYKYTGGLNTNIIIQHDLNISDKKWVNKLWLEKWFFEEPQNITVFVLLVDNSLYFKKFDEINQYIKCLGYIDYFHLKRVLSLRKKLVLFDEIDIKILDKNIKLSSLVHKKINL